MENKTLKHFIKKRKLTLIISFKKKEKKKCLVYRVGALFYVAADDCYRYYEVQLHAPLSRMFDAVILLGRFEVR